MASKAHIPGREDKMVKTEKKYDGKKLTLIIASAVLLLGCGGGGAFWYLNRAQDGMEVQVKQKPPVFVNLETFTVNLQSEYGAQHL